MGWKNWPSWLKGGIIGAVVAVCLFIITYLLIIIGAATKIKFLSIYPIMLFTFSSWPISSLVGKLVGLDGMGGAVLIIALLVPLGAIINYFIVGALIGWIVGKIKK